MSTKQYILTGAQVTVNAPKPTMGRTVAYRQAIAVVDTKNNLVSITPPMRTEVKNKKIFEMDPVKVMTRKEEGRYMLYCEVDADDDEMRQLALMGAMQAGLEAAFAHNKKMKK